MDSNSRSLNTLTDMQNSGNQRLGMLFDSANQAGNRANQRFGMGASAFNPMDASSQNDINRWTAMINPLVAGQGTATNRAALFSGMPGQGLSAGLNSQDSRIGTGASLFGNSAGSLFNGGMSGMNNANGSATQNLGTWGNIWGQGDNSMINRMTLGNNAINGGSASNLGFLGAGNNGVGTQLNYGMGSGQLGNSVFGTMGNNMNGMINSYRGFGQDRLNGETLNNNAFGQFFNNSNNNFNPLLTAMGQGSGAYGRLIDGTLNYMTAANNLYGPYAGMMGMGQSPTNYYANLMGRQGGY